MDRGDAEGEIHGDRSGRRQQQQKAVKRDMCRFGSSLFPQRGAICERRSAVGVPQKNAQECQKHDQPPDPGVDLV